MTFETAPVCPYCGAEYKLVPMEIENIRNIELKRVEEEKEARRQKRLKTIEEKVASYTNPKQCQNWIEVTQWCKINGFKPGYAYILAQKMGMQFGKVRKYGTKRRN